MNQLQGTDTNSEDSYSDDDSPKRRRDLLTRRPSYHRILKDITGPDIAGEFLNNDRGSSFGTTLNLCFNLLFEDILTIRIGL